MVIVYCYFPMVLPPCVFVYGPGCVHRHRPPLPELDAAVRLCTSSDCHSSHSRQPCIPVDGVELGRHGIWTLDKVCYAQLPGPAARSTLVDGIAR